jgi:hypothetical protein
MSGGNETAGTVDKQLENRINEPPDYMKSKNEDDFQIKLVKMEEMWQVQFTDCKVKMSIQLDVHHEASE